MKFPNLKAGDIVTVRYAGRLFPACTVVKIMSDYRVRVRIAHDPSGMEPFNAAIERHDVVCYASTAADRASR